MFSEGAEIPVCSLVPASVTEALAVDIASKWPAYTFEDERVSLQQFEAVKVRRRQSFLALTMLWLRLINTHPHISPVFRFLTRTATAPRGGGGGRETGGGGSGEAGRRGRGRRAGARPCPRRRARRGRGRRPHPRSRGSCRRRKRGVRFVVGLSVAPTLEPVCALRLVVGES